ncbi:MAG: DUF927 domain-containing protein [Faecousia sp.]
MGEDEIITIPPQIPQYTYEEFKTPVPYQYLCDHFSGSEVAMQFATLEMADNAKAVGFTGFKDTLKIYQKQNRAAAHRGIVLNTTEFTNQPIELNCADWECWDSGISRIGKSGLREQACSHPIMPVERLKNIDTGEVKVRLAFNRSGRAGKWQSTIVDMATISSTRTIVPALANLDISVTGNTAPALVDYLNEIAALNREIIPEHKAIGRLGYIPGEGFSPYVEGLVFDGDASYRNLYGSVSSKGNMAQWQVAAYECRKMSVTARIMLAASFASPLLSVVGSLPFFVHLWGVDSGTGKTVALMLAASVWGNPAVGSYTQTFNGTQVGQERTAAFLNHLPYCLDELQLTKDSRGKSNFDVYQLAQGVGRSRGKRTGGIEVTPTWDCCFLTTGESPLTSISSGAGAVNRVIDIECTAGNAVITDGPRISSMLKQNYGFAGRIFVEKLYESDKVLSVVREIYRDYYKELCSGNSTEKQAMAAAAILTADLLASKWVYGDTELVLTPEDICTFLASKEAVSAGKRAYDWLCDWVAANVNHFAGNEVPPAGEVYGKIEGDIAYINRSIFSEELQNAGYSAAATLSYLKANDLIEYRAGKSNAKSKSINGHKTECIVLRLSGSSWVNELSDEDLLPL